LDVGCGEGILLERLGSNAYSRFVGVDISETAIARARKKCFDRSFFTQADAADYVTDETFDAIIFNEVLYYFPDPVAMAHKYRAWLKPDGLMITSLYARSDRARAIGRLLRKNFRTVDEVEITSHGERWIIDVFLPSYAQSNRLSAGIPDGS
jgi:2-polyprenyl-6-hydroxyphenyl methylase/3-demethylubiquinone-9 3-methyltransferase